MSDVFSQRAWQVRLDWGHVGAVACAADIGVVVDVLSFSTSVTVAVDRGTHVIPCPWDGERAQALAAERDAVLAVGRLDGLRGGVAGAPSLSPAGLLTVEPVERLVLPSPNGSAISAALADAGATVVVGCLRNAGAVASWLAPALDAGRSVVVVAAGERWSVDRSLRPALEDHLGAGAILAHLAALGYVGSFSPEARAAALLADAAGPGMGELLADCVGARELSAAGFAADVAVAAEVDVSAVVPVLRHGAFEAWRRPDLST